MPTNFGGDSRFHLVRLTQAAATMGPSTNIVRGMALGSRKARTVRVYRRRRRGRRTGAVGAGEVGAPGTTGAVARVTLRHRRRGARAPAGPDLRRHPRNRTGSR